jgi:hypothetical protein
MADEQTLQDDEQAFEEVEGMDEGEGGEGEDNLDVSFSPFLIWIESGDDCL